MKRTNLSSPGHSEGSKNHHTIPVPYGLNITSQPSYPYNRRWIDNTHKFSQQYTPNFVSVSHLLLSWLRLQPFSLFTVFNTLTDTFKPIALLAVVNLTDLYFGGRYEPYLPVQHCMLIIMFTPQDTWTGLSHCCENGPWLPCYSRNQFEQLFSKSRHLCTEVRSSMKANTITESLLSKCWIKDGIFDRILCSLV